MMKNKGKKVILSCLVLGILLIVVGVSFAFHMLSFSGNRKHLIKAADMDVELVEDDSGIELTDAYPVYDEVGMLGDAYTFRLVNRGGIRATYILRLKNVTEGDNQLVESDVKIGFSRNGINRIVLFSSLPADRRIDFNILKAGEIVEYSLRLWIKDSVTDGTTGEGKTFKVKAEVELTDEKTLSLARMKQGSYVDYTGSNGCSGNYCKGANACSSFNISGWRIAYIEGNRAYLISSGASECYNKPYAENGTEIAPKLNAVSKKYCNKDFVDGDCSNNNDSWSMHSSDFEKIIKQATGIAATPFADCFSRQTKQCGNGINLIDNGGNYWIRSSSNGTYNRFISYWLGTSHTLSQLDNNRTYGVRSIIRMSSSVYITGGEGTAVNPYKIANETYD